MSLNQDAFLKLLHVMNLNGRGGMEQLAAAYLAMVPHQSGHHGIAIKSKIHPAFKAYLAQHQDNLFFVKNWGWLPAPKQLGLRARNIKRIIRRFQADRVVFWSTSPDPEWQYACRQLGVSMVYYDHGKSWVLDADRGREGLKAFDYAVTVSSAGRAMLKQRLAFDGPIAIVPNGLRLAPHSGENRYRADGVLRLGFAGRLIAKKGVPILIAAAARLRARGWRFHLRIAGEGSQADRIAQLIADQGLQDHVTMLGHQDDMGAFYRETDILVMPSIAEPFGLTAIEAAASGAVPIVADVDGLAETVAPEHPELRITPTLDVAAYEALGGNGKDLPTTTYRPGDDTIGPPQAIAPEALADRISELASQPDTLRELADHLAQWTRQRFDMERYAADLTNALVASRSTRESLRP